MIASPTVTRVCLSLHCLDYIGSQHSQALLILSQQLGNPLLNRPGFELTPQKLDGGDPADQAVFLSRYSTGLSPCNPSLIRSWL